MGENQASEAAFLENPSGAPMLIALTREVSRALAACELTHLERRPIDFELAVSQHRAYLQVLGDLGCKVLALEAEPDLPDAVFVEDVAVVLDELAVMTRPGAASRRAESGSVDRVLQQFRVLHRIQAPGTLDGGDVMRMDRTLYVGQSSRSNARGIAQLRACVEAFGYEVRALPICGCLHLKSAVSALDDRTVLLQQDWVSRDCFADFDVIEVDPDEPHAANVLRIGSHLVMPACFPRSRQRLVDAGFDVTTVDLSELQKAEGATTCCSLVFEVPGVE